MRVLEPPDQDLEERRAEVLAEAAEAGKSYAHRDFSSRKTRMTALRNPKGTTIALRRGLGKIIYDFFFDLFDSHVHLLCHHLSENRDVRINTPVRLFTRYVSECKVPKPRKTNKTVLLYKKGDPHDIDNYRPICLLSVIYKLFTRVILKRLTKT